MPKAPPMRHFNSPEERAKREATPADPKRTAGFRHYNSPEEVAKRQAASAPSAAVVVPPRAAAPVSAPPAWPPAGQDNTASVVVETTAEPPRSPGEALDADELRMLRVILNNYPALEAAHRRLTHRVRQLEAVFEEEEVRLAADVPEPEPEPSKPEE